MSAKYPPFPRQLQTRWQRIQFCRVRKIHSYARIQQLLNLGLLFVHHAEGVGLRQAGNRTPHDRIHHYMMLGRFWIATGKR